MDDDVVLIADDDLVDRLARLEDMGITVREAPWLPRTLLLVDAQGAVLVSAVLEADPVEHIREMVAFCELVILQPKVTRH